MNVLAKLGGMLASALLLSPTAAQAASHANMTFSGVVGATATGVVSAYLDPEDGGATSFAGQPMSITLGITQPDGGGDAYVDHFTAQWSDQTYGLPFITHYDGDGLPSTPENENVFGFFSSVTLTSLGGHVSIFPTPLFVAATDGDFALTFDFAYSTPHTPYTKFSDGGLTGGGTFDAFFTFLIDPDIGPYDADSAGPFTLSGVRASGSVPEPDVWAVMILGFAAAGAALRRRRGLASAVA